MKIKLIITFVIIISSLAILSFGINNTNQNSSIVIMDLEKFLEDNNNTKFLDREVRLRGFVKIGSILKTNKDKAEFIMEQNHKEIKINYNGKTQLPDTFTDGAPIRVDGILQNNGIFISNNIEAKCASKYEVPQKTKL